MSDRMERTGFDREEHENEDPLGERTFEEAGFADAEGGGPDFHAPGLEGLDKRPGGEGQKVAGVPEDRQRQVNTPSEQRPDSQGYVVKERGGESKGDPSVGGTRPE